MLDVTIAAGILVKTISFVGSDLPAYYELKTNNGNRDYCIQIGGHYMNYNTVYVEWTFIRKVLLFVLANMKMKKAFITREHQPVTQNVLRYLAFLRTIYGEYTRFVCTALFFLYHQLCFNVEMCDPCTNYNARTTKQKDGSKQTKEMRRSLLIFAHFRYIFQRKQIIRQKNSSVCVMIIKRN